jgi:hypothetical protein
MTRAHLDVHTATEAAIAPPGAVALTRDLAELHRPSQRPYKDVPGLVLTQCRVCDGRRSRVQRVGDAPQACRVWRDAVTAGVVSG